jgi:peptidoglycan-associated lipoprotein
MRNYILALTILFFACNATKPTAPLSPTTSTVKPAASFVTWDKKMVDIGKVKKGDKKSLFFEFTNTSKEDIQIDIVDACECTKIEFPRGIITPNGKGRLDVLFNSTEKDTSETIGINVVFKNTAPDGNPRIEVVEYKFDIEK